MTAGSPPASRRPYRSAVDVSAAGLNRQAGAGTQSAMSAVLTRSRIREVGGDATRGRSHGPLRSSTRTEWQRGGHKSIKSRSSRVRRVSVLRGMGLLSRAWHAAGPVQTVLIAIVICNVVSAAVYIAGLICLLSARSHLRQRNDARRRTILRGLGVFEREEDEPRPIVGFFHPYWFASPSKTRLRLTVMLAAAGSGCCGRRSRACSATIRA